MRITLLSIAALLGACALTPQGVRETGTRFEFQLAKAPEAAAWCIARNAEEMSVFNWAATVRPAASPGGFEVIVRVGGADVFAVAQVPATGRTTIWIRRQYIFSHEGAAKEMIAGC